MTGLAKALDATAVAVTDVAVVARFFILKDAVTALVIRFAGPAPEAVAHTHGAVAVRSTSAVLRTSAAFGTATIDVGLILILDAVTTVRLEARARNRACA